MVPGSEVPGSRFSATAVQKKTAGQIEKVTLKERLTNIEQEITNIEVSYSVIFIKKTE